MFTPECGAAADSPHYMLMLATLIVSPRLGVYSSTATAAVKICIGPQSCAANCPHLWWLRTPGAAPWCARNARPGARAQCSPPWACWEIASICVQDVVNTAAELHSAKMMLKVLHCYPTLLVTSYQKPWGQEMMALSWPGPCYGSWLQVITSASAIMECNKREQIAAHPGSPGSPGHGQSGGDTPLILLKILYPILYPPPPGLCKLYRRPPLKIQSREDIPPCGRPGLEARFARYPPAQAASSAAVTQVSLRPPYLWGAALGWTRQHCIVTFQHRRSCAILRCVQTTMNIYLRFPIIASPPLVMCHQINAQLARPRLWSARVTRAGPRLLRVVACCIFVRWAFITAQPEEPRLEERGLDTAHWQHITYTACCCCGDTQPPHSTFSQATIHF